MAGLKSKWDRFAYRFRQKFTFDNIILVIALGFCLAWTYGSIDSMSRNWSLAREVMNREREKEVLELEVETYALENEYYLSAEYQDLAARKYQGKKSPGESMVYLPANSELAQAKHKPDQATTASSDTVEMTNFEQWLAFLFGI